MEEARQHTPLTVEQQAFFVVLFGGLLAFAGGVAAVFAGYKRGIDWGLAIFIGSRVAVAAWQLLRPRVKPGQEVAKGRVTFILVIWCIIGGLLIYVKAITL